jgi:thioredoxin-related protein
MKFIALLVLEFFALASCARAQEVLHDPNLAFSNASRSGKDILLIFSGSDWCMPCIRFEKKVLADTAFRHFAAANLILLEADFPQRKKIPDSLRTAYDGLAAKFDADGEFPRIVLVTAERRLVTTLPYSDQSPAEFMTVVKAYIPSDQK